MFNHDNSNKKTVNIQNIYQGDTTFNPQRLCMRQTTRCQTNMVWTILDCF